MIELGYTLFTTEKCADKCRYLFIDNGEQVFSDSVDKFVYTNQLNF